MLSCHLQVRQASPMEEDQPEGQRQRISIFIIMYNQYPGSERKIQCQDEQGWKSSQRRKENTNVRSRDPTVSKVLELPFLSFTFQTKMKAHLELAGSHFPRHPFQEDSVLTWIKWHLQILPDAITCKLYEWTDPVSLDDGQCVHTLKITRCSWYVVSPHRNTRPAAYTR